MAKIWPYLAESHVAKIWPY